MRFIATADWQLGMTAHFLGPEARARYLQARLDAVVRIGELAKQHGAAFVAVAGDVFESNQLRRGILMQAFEALRSCQVPVVLLPGNHDPLDAASIYQDPAFVAHCPSHVVVLRDSAAVTIAPGVEVVGAPWLSKRPHRDLVRQACSQLTAPAPGQFRVVLGHGAVARFSPDRESLDVIDDAALIQLIRDGLAHFVVLGDRHSTTEVASGIWYPGSPEVTHRREVEPGQVLLVNLGDGEPQVTKLRTGTWSFKTIEQQLLGETDVDALLTRLDSIKDKARCALWLRLTGTVTMAEHARLELGLEQRRELFAKLELWQRHSDLAIVPGSAELTDLGLSGFARTCHEELLTDSATDPVAQDALALLYRLAGASS